MKKLFRCIKKIIFFYLIIINIMLIIPENSVYGADDTESEVSEEEILKTQQDNLNIDDFIKEADTYTKNVYEDIDMGELFTSAISGNIDNESILKSILHSAGRRSI